MISFACLAPHGWLAVPLLCGPDDAPARATQSAMEELGRQAERVLPETIVLITPHGLMVEGAISLLCTPVVSGTTEGMPWASESKHSLRLEFEVDTELSDAICDAVSGLSTPVVRVTNHASWEPLALDFGSLIPLWYIGAAMQPRPKVVIICPDRRLRPIAIESCYYLGMAIQSAVTKTGRRVAFVASGDLGHAHDPEHAYGFDAAAAEWDAAVVDAILRDDLGALAAFDRSTLDRAKTDAFGPLLCLHGVLAGSNLGGRLLSYEAPTYFGMACAVWSECGGSDG